MNEPRRHPSEEALIAHLLGENDLARRVVLETHLSFCPPCQRTMTELRAAGDLHWRQDATPAPLPAPEVWTRLVARLDAEGRPPSPTPDLPLPPAALAELVPGEIPSRWRAVPLTTGSYRQLDPRPSSTQLLLVRMGAGRRFPRHRHLGSEEVVVLTGGYHDESEHVVAGDYSAYAAGSEHGPQVDDDGTCFLVTRIEHGVVFLGWRGLLAWLVGRLRAAPKLVL